MKLFDFIKNETRCPICDNPLTLCLQLVDDTLFIGSQTNEFFTFIPFRNAKNKRKDDTIHMSLNNGYIDLNMSSTHVTEIFNKSQFFFYYVCKINGFSTKDTNDCSISIYDSCYYKSSPFFHIVKEVTPEDQVIWKIKTVNETSDNLISATEQYAFSKKNDDELTKAYVVSVDYEDKKTSFWHYSFTPAQEADENFEPKLFEKFMPLLPHRLKASLENRENLFSKFESWILMS